jgi:hypothetical protein
VTQSRYYEFCQYEEHGGALRCVAGSEHLGNHDLQPSGALSVRTIRRQEAEMDRLGYPREVEPAEVVEAIDAAIAETDPENVRPSA